MEHDYGLQGSALGAAVSVPEGDFLTVREAVRLLKISRGTVHRWIKQGRLPAYRVGPKKVRILGRDLVRLITPAVRGEVWPVKEAMPIPTRLSVRPLGDEEAQRGLRALEAARALGRRILARREGRPFPDSTQLIRKAREERTKQLLGL